MDMDRFDALARALGSATSRRGVLAGLAALAPLLPAADGAARRRPRCNCRPGFACDAKRRCVCRSGLVCGRTCCGAGSLCCASGCAVPTWKNQVTFGGPGPESKGLGTPTGIAVSPDGLTAWVCETVAARVSVWTRPDAASADWTMAASFGSGPGSGAAELADPRGIAVSADGLQVWIADAFNNRVSIWSRPDAMSLAWAPQTTFGGAGTLSLPSDVTITADGLTALVADSGNNRVSVWTRPAAGSTAWTNATTFGGAGSGPGQLSDPRGVQTEADGLTVWVADSGNNRVSVWTRPAAGSTAWTNPATFGDAPGPSAPMDFPRGVAVTANLLSVFVSDSENYRVSIWTRPDAASTSWTNLLAFGSGPGVNPDQFDVPRGIAVSPDGGTAWIADTLNDRISVWRALCP